MLHRSKTREKGKRTSLGSCRDGRVGYGR